MRVLLILLILTSVSLSTQAQDITGKWNGLLKIQGVQLRLVFNVTKGENRYTSTMDSPDQGVKDIPVTTTTFEDPKVKFEVESAGIVYTGKLLDEKIKGTFKQGGQEFPMDLSREEVKKEEVRRPQEPTKPFPYYSEDVAFENSKADVSLAGTLTLPKKKGKYPVVILISGSGPQNRNEELLGHKPFLILSDYLTRNGIGVLRYDDRGVGESTGDFKAATSKDFATDVESAVEYLKTRKDIDKKNIGLIGHSEGGLIAPMVAAESDDVSFIVLLAGTGIQGDKLLLMQEELIWRENGMPEEEIEKSLRINTALFDIVLNSEDSVKVKEDLTISMTKMIEEDSTEIPEGSTVEDIVEKQVNQFATPWMLYFIRYNPAPTLEKVKCPVLAINGEKDLQVPPKENLQAIEKALNKGGNNKVTTKELAKLNHLFQESETGSPDEYASIEQTFSPIALEVVLEWINLQVD
ncbi:MAG: alpha/beta hydrolase [Fluviicola sp.]|nr:MAG: alpha/beta hydrolase [Fluviicola sp.]